MESYSYVNIFETKGLEYLLLASFLVLFVVLVPVVLSLEDPEPHHGVVHLGQRLVEPRLVRRDLGRDVDHRRVPVLVVEARLVPVEVVRHPGRVALRNH